MIVSRRFLTRRKVRRREGDGRIVITWRGWFLFGIIPLYLDQVNYKREV